MTFNTDLSRKQVAMLDLAFRTASESQVATHRHGAVITKGGRIMATGVNKWRNYALPASDDYNPNLTVHAEIDALAKVADARGAVVYIAQVGKLGNPKMSRPCPRCEKALIEAGVKQVVYTFSQIN